MKLQIKYINNKRAFTICPWHKSRNGTADLEITLTGTYQGKYFCWGCGKSGYVQMGVLKRLLKLRKKSGAKEPTAMDFESLYLKYFNQLHNLPLPFDVSPLTHALLLMGWDGEAYTIPFRSPIKRTVGLQRRFPDGFKCMVEGSSLGLIIPDTALMQNEPLYITEGASDLSVVLECGLQGIGRPNCSAIPEMIVEFCSTFKGPIIIVPDNDSPGINGAKALCVNGFENDSIIKMLIPEPYNDLYEMYEARGIEFCKEFLT